MANFTAADVKRLREQTGAGMMACKNALDEADGDIEAAIELLRLQGAKDVNKRATRTAANGLVVAELDGTARPTSSRRPTCSSRPPSRSRTPPSAPRSPTG
jgi:elongation factor Ts